MPLLKKKHFEQTTTPELLRDDEEVFYCQLTNEIFRDYDEFCQRVILCQSTVWSCSLTGKSNLTYAEALESEENARKLLSSFPKTLVVPVLFVASRTKRTGFLDMTEDVFLFVKDRFFIGESVESVSSGYKWKNARVVEVVPPTQEQIKQAQKNGENSQSNIIPPSLYKYKIEQFNSKGLSRIIEVTYRDLKRKRVGYSREKSRMFLKQKVETNEMGIWVVKDSILEEHGINEIKLSDIFAGPEPDFDRSKKLLKAVNGKKVRQESIAKYLQKTTPGSNKTAQKNQTQEDSKERINLLEEMRRKEMEFKQKQAEEKLALKQKKKENTVKITMQFKDFYKTKDDLELNDQKPLPELLAVNCKIPDKYMGDVLMLMEFSKSFAKVLQTTKFFPQGLTLDLMERALMEKEVAGPLIDIVQMFLCALFNVQDEEASQYKTVVENSSGVKSEKLAEDLTVTNATYLATQASHYSVKYQGLPLGRLPLYSLTVSEILRLHLLASGARINENGARWRYQQRGGYTCQDDPGLHFRLKQPHIIKSLATHNVVQLSIKDKLKILSCLMDQLLTYADVRDIIDHRLDQSKQAHIELKTLRAAEKRRQQEYLNSRIKVRQEEMPENKIDAELESMKRLSEKKRLEYERKVEKLVKAERAYQVVLGQDRAFRKYVKLEGVPGVFVYFEESEPGVCLKEPIKNDKELVDASRAEILAYLKKSYEESNLNDKENHPKGSPKKVNGVRNSLPQTGDVEAECDNLLMCSANPQNCIVHSTSKRTQRWLYFHDQHQIDELINALNKRGVREQELSQILQDEKELLADIIQKTPVTQLNPLVSDEFVDQKQKTRKSTKSRYDDANLGYPADMDLAEVLESTLVDYILDLEEKIFAGNVGSLKVKDRSGWRERLAQRKYSELDKAIVKVENGRTSAANNDDNESRASTPDSLCEDFPDPGKYLGQAEVETADSDGESNKPLQRPDTIQTAVNSLSIALIQVAQSVEPKFMKRPLGHADKKDGKKEKMDVLEKWEQSLLASTSFSQIFLHYATLDNCIMWSRSALLARCKICRRQRDSENMLLCDSCNQGHHLYCLKPKLKAVPAGEWFCDRCLKQKELEEREKNPEPVKKRRRIFRDEDVDDDEEQQEEVKPEVVKVQQNGKREVVVEEDDDDDEEEEEEDEEEEEEEESEEESQANRAEPEEVCDRCGFGGELLCCDKCPSLYHLECVDPPLRRVPRGEWLCHNCKQKREKKRRREEVRMYIDPSVVQRPGAINNQRRCAARAQLKIHGFIKSLRRMSESEDSDSEELPTRRSSRREEIRDDLPLHNAALQELLADVMKHKDAWAFIRPVQKTEVPDYYEVIAKPMDFGTIKYKLNMGEYKHDAELMADAVLVFENCNTYNDTDAEVYKCGVRLLKHFEKKSKELGLKLPEEMEETDSSDAESSQAKKVRIK